MKTRENRKAVRAAIIATARKYVGYQSELLGRTGFGERVGYQSQPWAGAFIDVVLRESGLHGVPSFVYTPAALAEFIRTGNVTKNPQPGDIAIFNFASTTASAFSAPHAGIVIDVRHLSTSGELVTIEGNTTGTTSYQQQDGVHTRMRHLTDAVIFCRVDKIQEPGRLQLLTKRILKMLHRELRVELAEIEQAASIKETLQMKMIRTGTRNKQIATIQLALSTVTDLQGAEQGKWDQVTASSFARFQRNIGRVGADATGAPELTTLQRLSKDTGLFEIE